MKDRINYRPPVPCFGNDPSTDLELLRRVSKQIQTDYTHFIIIIAGLITVSIVSAIVAIIL